MMDLSSSLKIIAHPFMRMFVLTLSLACCIWLLYAFAYVPFEEGLPDEVGFTVDRPIRLKTDLLNDLLDTSTQRTSYRPQLFTRAQAVFAHEKTN